MSITALTLTNPGAELGNVTGWTLRAGDSSRFSAQALDPHSGTYRFLYRFSSVFSQVQFDQEIDVSAYSAVIDADTAAVRGLNWGATGGSSSISFYVQAYDTSHVQLASWSTDSYASGSYVSKPLTKALPIGTRYVRIGVTGGRLSSTDVAVWDDFSLEISDNRHTDYPGIFEPQVQQAIVYAVGGQTADDTKTHQAPILATVAAETSSGDFKVYGYQFFAYALVKKHGDKRKLRAWTFPQDDHKFYVLQLGNSNGTLIYDQLTQQWAAWKSADEVYWRGEDGCDWEGFNVCCDTLTGKIFKIDPVGRLDYNDTTDTEDTPITSIVVGGTTERFRKNIPCYMAELAISEGQPPEGIDATTVGISLLSRDTLVAYDHGSVLGTTTGDRVTVRWYGLGLMGSPGRVFEITDTGYARRIDGLNIEVGDQNGSQ